MRKRTRVWAILFVVIGLPGLMFALMAYNDYAAGRDAAAVCAAARPGQSAEAFFRWTRENGYDTHQSFDEKTQEYLYGFLGSPEHGGFCFVRVEQARVVSSRLEE